MRRQKKADDEQPDITNMSDLESEESTVNKKEIKKDKD